MHLLTWVSREVVWTEFLFQSVDTSRSNVLLQRKKITSLYHLYYFFIISMFLYIRKYSPWPWKIHPHRVLLGNMVINQDISDRNQTCNGRKIAQNLKTVWLSFDRPTVISHTHSHTLIRHLYSTWLTVINTDVLSFLLPPLPPFFLVSRGDLCVQHPWAGGAVRSSGAERYVWRGSAEGPWPGGLRAAEGIHLHHSGSWLRLRPRGHGGQKVPQVSKTDSKQHQQGLCSESLTEYTSACTVHIVPIGTIHTTAAKNGIFMVWLHALFNDLAGSYKVTKGSTTQDKGADSYLNKILHNSYPNALAKLCTSTSTYCNIYHSFRQQLKPVNNQVPEKQWWFSKHDRLNC